MKCTLCRVTCDYAHRSCDLYVWEGKRYPVCLACSQSPRFHQNFESWKARMEYVRLKEVSKKPVETLQDWERDILSCDPLMSSLKEWQKTQDANPFY